MVIPQEMHPATDIHWKFTFDYFFSSSITQMAHSTYTVLKNISWLVYIWNLALPRFYGRQERV